MPGSIFFAVAKHRVMFRAQDAEGYLDHFNLQGISERMVPGNVVPNPFIFQSKGPSAHSTQSTFTMANTSESFAYPPGTTDSHPTSWFEDLKIVRGEVGDGNFGCPSGEVQIDPGGDLVLTAREAGQDCDGLVCTGLNRTASTAATVHFIQSAEVNKSRGPCVHGLQDAGCGARVPTNPYPSHSHRYPSTS